MRTSVLDVISTEKVIYYGEYGNQSETAGDDYSC